MGVKFLGDPKVRRPNHDKCGKPCLEMRETEPADLENYCQCTSDPDIEAEEERWLNYIAECWKKENGG